MVVEVPAWTLAAFLLLAAVAGWSWRWRSTRTTRARSPRTSFAGDVWQTEVDAALADLASQISGLSSTLRKLHGRESQRQRRDPGEASTLGNEKDELRRRYGILPKARDA